MSFPRSASASVEICSMRSCLSVTCVSVRLPLKQPASSRKGSTSLSSERDRSNSQTSTPDVRPKSLQKATREPGLLSSASPSSERALFSRIAPGAMLKVVRVVFVASTPASSTASDVDASLAHVSDFVVSLKTNMSQCKNPSFFFLFSISARPISSFAREGKRRSFFSTSSIVSRLVWTRSRFARAGSTPGSLKDRPSRLRLPQLRSAFATTRTPTMPSLLLLRLRSVIMWLLPNASHSRENARGTSTILNRSLSLRSKLFNVGHVVSILQMPGTSSNVTSFCETLIDSTVSFSLVMNQSAERPFAVRVAFRKFQLGRWRARSEPRVPAAMRHVLFMYRLLRNSEAVLSLIQPCQPAPAGGARPVTRMSRCSAYRPSWKERCLNWYCAGALSDCFASVAQRATP